MFESRDARNFASISKIHNGRGVEQFPFFQPFESLEPHLGRAHTSLDDLTTIDNAIEETANGGDGVLFHDSIPYRVSRAYIFLCARTGLCMLPGYARASILRLKNYFTVTKSYSIWRQNITYYFGNILLSSGVHIQGEPIS